MISKNMSNGEGGVEWTIRNTFNKKIFKKKKEKCVWV